MNIKEMIKPECIEKAKIILDGALIRNETIEETINLLREAECLI